MAREGSNSVSSSGNVNSTVWNVVILEESPFVRRVAEQYHPGFGNISPFWQNPSVSFSSSSRMDYFDRILLILLSFLINHLRHHPVSSICYPPTSDGRTFLPGSPPGQPPPVYTNVDCNPYNQPPSQPPIRRSDYYPPSYYSPNYGYRSGPPGSYAPGYGSGYSYYDRRSSYYPPSSTSPGYVSSIYPYYSPDSRTQQNPYYGGGRVTPWYQAWSGSQYYPPPTYQPQYPPSDPYGSPYQPYPFPYGRTPRPPTLTSREATAIIKGHTASSIDGTIEFCQLGINGVQIKGRITGLPKKNGWQAMAILENNSCPRPDQLPIEQKDLHHYNPFRSSHGPRDSQKKHIGDLGNIFVNFDGTSTFDFVAPSLILDDPTYTIANHSIVIMDGEDDGGANSNPESNRVGNSGRAIACGVIVARLPPSFGSPISTPYGPRGPYNFPGGSMPPVDPGSSYYPPSTTYGDPWRRDSTPPYPSYPPPAPYPPYTYGSGRRK